MLNAYDNISLAVIKQSFIYNFVYKTWCIENMNPPYKWVSNTLFSLSSDIISSNNLDNL